MRDHGWGDVDLDEVDGSTNRFSITNVKASVRRRVIHWLAVEAEKQSLAISLEEI